jgi:deoxyribose-phosphate aldolase
METTMISLKEIAGVIDHSLLRPELTMQEIRQGCAVARHYDVISVCARPSDMPIVVEELIGTAIKATTVIGFPHGGTTTESKVAEALDAIRKGAVEVDMVLNIGRLRSGEYDYIDNEIREVVSAAHAKSALVKVIFENYYLSDQEKIVACGLAEAAGADFVKTSTGYAEGGATIPDLLLMRRTCSRHVQVKAAGGVRTLDEALAVIATGTTRIGTRSTQAIMEEARKRADATGKLPFMPGRDLSPASY